MAFEHTAAQSLNCVDDYETLQDSYKLLTSSGIHDLIRGAFSRLRTGFAPGERTEEKATFYLPQWPGLVWPYPIGDRSCRDPETGMLVPDTWTRRFLGVHPDILAKAGLSRNQAELDLQNSPPDFFEKWMDCVASVMLSFVLGGGAMAVRSSENPNQWDVRNTYRLTVWMLLQAQAPRGPG